MRIWQLQPFTLVCRSMVSVGATWVLEIEVVIANLGRVLTRHIPIKLIGH
jgi:hypothetical protein